jgi:hypothetical protein
MRNHSDLPGVGTGLLPQNLLYAFCSGAKGAPTRRSSFVVRVANHYPTARNGIFAKFHGQGPRRRDSAGKLFITQRLQGRKAQRKRWCAERRSALTPWPGAYSKSLQEGDETPDT